MIPRRRRSVAYRALATPALAALAVCALPSMPAACQDARSAGAKVERFQSALLALAGEAAELDHRERVERTRPLVDETFDVAFLARSGLGELWNDLDADERERLVSVLRDLAAASLAARLDRYAGASFGPVDEQHEPDGVALVTCLLTRADHREIPVEHRLHDVGGAWLVAGPLLDGVDAIPIEWEASRVLLAREGLSALLSHLQDRVARFGWTPAQVIERLQSSLLDVMKEGQGLGFRGRYERLAAIVDDTHDLAVIARLSLSRSWKKLGEEERRRFTELFRALSISTYASRFDNYSGETFAVTESRELRKGGALVRTSLTKADGDAVQLDYLMQRAAGRWRVINVTADGVSDLALRRAEYKSVLDRKGFSSLTDKLEDQIARYASGEKD